MERSARYRAITLCLLFGVVQTLGVVIPRHTNIHANIWPAFGLLLLVPRIALAAVLGLAWGVIFAVPVNALAWYAVARWLRRE